MVMNPEAGAFAQMVECGLEPELYSLEILGAFATYLAEQAIPEYPVHLKLDTGMHRLGFLPGEIAWLQKWLEPGNALRVRSVFTHLVASEDPLQDAFTEEQARIFESCCRQLAEIIHYPFVRHLANTAAITRHPHLHLDMVRLGIGLFGFSNTRQAGMTLQPATRLLTTVAQVKKVAAGQTVGYGRQGILLRDSLIATVRIGYADGYPRQLSNGIGHMWVRNTRVPVVGRVCMDMTMLDVTGVAGVEAGDRVEVFGPQIPVDELARLCQTIPYEIMTGISQRVKRVLVDE
jgi:alanine racemase